MKCGVRDDGTLYFVDDLGKPMPEHLVEVAKKQNREAIIGLVQRKCDEINEQVEALGRMHLDTPDARQRPQFIAERFNGEQPVMKQPIVPGFFDRVFKSRMQRIRDANEAADESYREAKKDWERSKATFDREVAKRKVLVESLIYLDVSAMESFLEECLQEVIWPRETAVSIDVRDGGKVVLLDVDLPEVEDMPTKLAAVPARGLKLSIKDLAQTKVQRLYAEHIHGIVFRLAGEALAALPASDRVIVSGYSQRRDKATAQLRDDYLLSVRIERPKWLENDFAHLGSLDVVEALGRHDLRREMSKTGLFKPIAPHDA